MSEVDENRGLLDEAKELEERRVELTALAIENNVADLLPKTWRTMSTFKQETMVEVTFETALEEEDGVRLSERDCRKLVSFVGEIADRARKQKLLGEGWE